MNFVILQVTNNYVSFKKEIPIHLDCICECFLVISNVCVVCRFD